MTARLPQVLRTGPGKTITLGVTHYWPPDRFAEGITRYAQAKELHKTYDMDPDWPIPSVRSSCSRRSSGGRRKRSGRPRGA